MLPNKLCPTINYKRHPSFQDIKMQKKSEYLTNQWNMVCQKSKLNKLWKIPHFGSINQCGQVSAEAGLFCSSQFKTKQSNGLFLFMRVLSLPWFWLPLIRWWTCSLVIFSKLDFHCSLEINMPHTRLMVLFSIYIVGFAVFVLTVSILFASSSSGPYSSIIWEETAK